MATHCGMSYQAIKLVASTTGLQLSIKVFAGLGSASMKELACWEVSL
jgi:hypothetical protein